MRTRSSFLIIGFASVCAVAACSSGKSKPSGEIPVKAYPVQLIAMQSVELQKVYPVTLRGKEDIEVKPRIDGYIDAVLVDEGAVVSRGQALFKISSPTADENLKKAEANYNTASLDVERLRPLAEKGIISEVRLNSAENVYRGAKASLQQAIAMQNWTTVTSPINGVVGAIPLRTGSLVNSVSVLTTIANTTSVIAHFSMNEKELYEFLNSTKGSTQAEKIKNMPPVKLLLADGSEYSHAGRIETISGLVDVMSGSVVFRASFPNPLGLLRSGASGKVIIPEKVANVALIPQKATFKQQDKVLTFKLQGDSVVQQIIRVKPMPEGNNYAVIEGLIDGETIVTDGVATLRNGLKIKTCY